MKTVWNPKLHPVKYHAIKSTPLFIYLFIYFLMLMFSSFWSNLIKIFSDLIDLNENKAFLLVLYYPRHI